MKISLEQVSKRFLKYRIFKDVNQQFATPGTYALLGNNGSGKSTLMRIIAGMQAPTKGKVRYERDGKELAKEAFFRQISFCAPGMEIVEDLSLSEFLHFHFTFKRALPGLSVKDMIAETGLQAVAGEPIGNYSSGMKQRVKLAQAFFSDTPVLLLDEPCTNLDTKGVDQYRDWITRYGKDRLLIVASNDPREYDFCSEQLLMEHYK
jgi:ABC-type multidrug transport system ATPase subunit